MYIYREMLYIKHNTALNFQWILSIFGDLPLQDLRTLSRHKFIQGSWSAHNETT